MVKKEIYCNKCGKKFDICDEQQAFSIKKYLGYGSEFDGEVIEIDFCCDCMDEIIKSCVINPFMQIDDDDYTY